MNSFNDTTFSCNNISKFMKNAKRYSIYTKVAKRGSIYIIHRKTSHIAWPDQHTAIFFICNLIESIFSLFNILRKQRKPYHLNGRAYKYKRLKAFYQNQQLCH